MLKIEKWVTPSPEQWEMTIEGMRNAMNSWDKSDSRSFFSEPYTDHIHPDLFELGDNDRGLMMRLNKGGAPHAKYRRYLPVHVTVTAPLYWWKEFETYRIGVASNPSDIEFNSCSTMHKIHAKEFTREDFSTEHLFDDACIEEECLEFDDGYLTSLGVMETTIAMLNKFRNLYLDTKERLVNANPVDVKTIVDKKLMKRYWYNLIQLLPSSYNQRRTIKMNYQVLYEIYEWRKGHKLDEWHTFCHWIEELPYSEIIIEEVETNG